MRFDNQAERPSAHRHPFFFPSITNDGRNTMKSKTAKEILAESLREVAETNQIDKITIRDIVDNCGYGKM
jgi:hypothetical protein